MVHAMDVIRLSLRRDREQLNEVLGLHARVLGPLQPRRLQRRLRGRRRLLLAALHEGRVVAYKFGYEDVPDRFYSWIGGVDPEFRRQGLGRRLMEVQHRWAQRHGYHRVRTHTSNAFKPMLILNLACGFDVIGTLINHKGEGRIILEKQL